MRGLRTQESERFQKFFAVVQQKAKEQGCVFFLESGEGNDMVTEAMEGEDLFGWLIPEEKASEFEEKFKNFNELEGWESNMRFAEWQNINGKIDISFR